ncbi:MAG: ABC transporter ATP-binding protein [Desulfosarcina sp.]|nr:ABC transporter ATP-binding protein [Desulfobacterales bacterium]
MPPILEVRHLSKHYGKLVAVDDVSFSIPAGICFGLLGPNGAGKTTTLEVIEDILKPTAGDILYKGHPRTITFKNEIGIQFQHTALLAMLTVQETLQVFQSLYPVSEDLEQLVAQCQLREFRHQRHENISGGQRQRFLLALALVNRPQLLFLDEPSTGLDPQARRNLWDIVNKIKTAGKTVILTTHYMEEAQHLCDTVAIMDHGRIIARGAPDELIRTHCEGITVVLPRHSFSQAPDSLPLPLQVTGETVRIQTVNIDDCLRQLLAFKVDLSEMTVHSPNLEHVFLNLTGRQLRE